jgi:hypothetical protein
LQAIVEATKVVLKGT